MRKAPSDVVEVVRLADQYAVPVIPYGAGSSLEGHLLAVQGGVSLDLSRMNHIVAIQPEDLTVTVQAGVTRKQLNDEIRHTGLFFPIDPGRRCEPRAACAPPAPAEPMRCATGPCAKTCSGLTVVSRRRAR